MKDDFNIISIPISNIESLYGQGNFDDLGDDISEIINMYSDYPGQYSVDYDFDTTHKNPYFHTMNIKVKDNGLHKKIIAHLRTKQLLKE